MSDKEKSTCFWNLNLCEILSFVGETWVQSINFGSFQHVHKYWVYKEGGNGGVFLSCFDALEMNGGLGKRGEGEKKINLLVSVGLDWWPPPQTKNFFKNFTSSYLAFFCLQRYQLWNGVRGEWKHQGCFLAASDGIYHTHQFGR